MFRLSDLTLRTRVLMVVANLPTICCALVLTVPGWVFNQPMDTNYYYFGRALAMDWVSLLPLVITAACAMSGQVARMFSISAG